MKDFSEKIEINLLRIIILFLSVLTLLIYLFSRIVLIADDIFYYKGTLFHPAIAIPLMIFVSLFFAFKLLKILRNYPSYAVFANDELRILDGSPIFANEVDGSSIKITGIGPGFVKFSGHDGKIFRIPSIFCKQSSAEIYSMLSCWISSGNYGGEFRGQYT